MKYYIFLLFIINFLRLAAQPANDNCGGAFNIADPTNFCSPFGGGTTQASTQSPMPAPSCAPTAFGDVWYSFTALSPEVKISINGDNSGPSPKLVKPKVALYEGECPDGLVEIACKAATAGNLVELSFQGLEIGKKYYFRVTGSSKGRFQYCVSNGKTEKNIAGDCPDAVRLCDKSSFTISGVEGPGQDSAEMEDAFCFFNGIGTPYFESFSAWFVWTCATSGTLEFTLTPTDPDDDIDFLVYKLPNGQGDCSNKEILRCMASGDGFPTSPCMGPTGLVEGDPDIDEDAGCLDIDDDAWLDALDMTAGETYALVVNNYTAFGNGFTATFGGTGTFVGPEAALADDESDDRICIGETIEFKDVSKLTSDSVQSWQWYFGPDATIESVGEEGPHTVQFLTEGVKTAVLEIQSHIGCRSSVVKNIEVELCCALEGKVKVTPGCPDSSGAVVTFSTENMVGPLKWTWSNGQTDSILTNIKSGNYNLVVKDATGCEDVIPFTVNTPLTLTVGMPEDTTILKDTKADLQVSVQPATDNTNVVWYVGTDTLKGLSIAPELSATTTFQIAVAVSNCVLYDSVTVEVVEKFFEIPNAFTPNGDMYNNVFRPVVEAGGVVKMRVWSRWGALIYEGTDGWDGKNGSGEDLPSDIYIYAMTVRYLDGIEEEKHGDIMLIR